MNYDYFIPRCKVAIARYFFMVVKNLIEIRKKTSLVSSVFVRFLIPISFKKAESCGF